MSHGRTLGTLESHASLVEHDADEERGDDGLLDERGGQDAEDCGAARA